MSYLVNRPRTKGEGQDSVRRLRQNNALRLFCRERIECIKWQMAIHGRMGWRHKAAHVLLRAVAVLMTRVPGSLSYVPTMGHVSI